MHPVIYSDLYSSVQVTAEECLFYGSPECELQRLEVLSVGGPDPGGTRGLLEGKG